jgi:hypothetical protein
VKPVDWFEMNSALGEIATALALIHSKIPGQLFDFTKFYLVPLGCYSKIIKIDSHETLDRVHTMQKHRFMRDYLCGQLRTCEIDKSKDIHGAYSAVLTQKLAFGVHDTVQLSTTACAAYQLGPLMNLYMDVNASFSLFPRSKFNSSLYGLFYCIHELGEFVRGVDPPLCMPYRINVGDGSGRSCTINAWHENERDGLSLLWNGMIGGATSSSSIMSSAEDFDEGWTRALKFAVADVKWLLAWCSKHSV